MSSFASLAFLVYRFQNKKRVLAKQSISGRTTGARREGNVQSLPRALSDSIPQELFERFIEFLRGDQHSLAVCSLVSRAWLPASRYHLFDPLIVRPIRLNCEWSLHINCSVALRGRRYILYGNKEGVYWSELERQVAPVQVLSLPDVSQIDIIEDHNLLICLSAHRVITIPLNILTLTSPQDAASCTIVSSHVSFFKIGTQLGRTFVCIIKSSISPNSVFKLMEPIPSPFLGSSELAIYKEFYIPERVISVHFLDRKIVAGTRNHGFEVINTETLDTQTLLDPASPIVSLGKKSLKCLAVYRTGEEFLLCYSVYGVYVDKSGHVSRSEHVQWISPVEAIVFRDPYIVAFGPSHIEVRHLRNNALLQTVWGSYRLLSASLELLTVQSNDGRVLGLQFSD